MNTGAPAGWSQNLHEDDMVPPAATEDDFANYLDLDLDFSSFDDVANELEPVDMRMDDFAMNLDVQGPVLRQAPNVSFHPPHVPLQPRRQAAQPRPSITAPVYQQARRYHRPQAIIPPTPSSNDLQGGVASYYHTSSGQMVCEPYHNKEDQMSFTPLVSPAVTPADAAFHMPDYALPAEYFSPLTSPAIEAQTAQYRSYQSSHGPDTGTTTSPAELNMEYGISAPSTPALPRSRRRTSLANKTGPRGGIRQSPISKPSVRKKQAGGNRDNVNVTEQSKTKTIGHAKNKQLSVQDDHCLSGSSEQDSVSPEALAEALMPPPAIPPQAQRSPAIAGQSKSPLINADESFNSAAPATPATLMRLRNDYAQQSPNIEAASLDQTSHASGSMEDILLPAPASGLEHKDSPPASSSRVKPKIAIDSSGAGLRSSDVLPSPATPVAPSPQTRSATADSSDPKGVKSVARNSRKRQSISSSQVSPAIRPKISPNIKPLMPNGGGGGLSADHSALYLASKSNYQNILEGTHLPGVTYPETLAENLSSKRTSHKIAEQGRRQRINTALKEIEGLLPPTQALLTGAKKDDSETPEGDGVDRGTNAVQTTSKANTVEMAIIYIKSLQAELADAKMRLNEAEKKLAQNVGASSQTTL